MGQMVGAGFREAAREDQLVWCPGGYATDFALFSEMRNFVRVLSRGVA